MDAPQPRSTLPAWVRQRDGRLAPFEADRISQTLFAATEALGQPDTFLARELTDGVLHFLTEECDDPIPTTAWLSDFVIKVVRELRQPELARVLAERALQQEIGTTAIGAGPPPTPAGDVVFHFSTLDAPAAVSRRCLEEYTLQAVFSRDLQAAHRDGLLTLGNLNAPLELAGCVLGPPAGRGATALVEALHQARALAGETLALDSPEHLATLVGIEDAAAFAHQLRLGLHGSDCQLTLNLNCATPPLWAEDNAGPLFADQARPGAGDRRAEFEDALLSEWRQAPAALGQLHWHLSADDFQPRADGACRQRLLRLARWAIEGAAVVFTFDRPRRSLALGVGLNRKHTATLLQVGLHLPRLLELPGVRGDEELLLKKLASLARLALSAAVQKRAFVRLQTHGADAALMRGFLLERARLVIAPVGLDAAVHTVTGRSLCEGKPGLEFATRLLQRLRTVLHADSRAALLETCVDGWLTTAAPTLHQVRIVGSLHALVEGGTAGLVLSPEAQVSPEALVELLHFTWRQTEVVRLRLARQQAPQPLSLL